MGFCDKVERKSVKRVDKPLHIIIFIINIFFPGIGTIITGCIGEDGCDAYTLVVGIL